MKSSIVLLQKVLSQQLSSHRVGVLIERDRTWVGYSAAVIQKLQLNHMTTEGHFIYQISVAQRVKLAGAVQQFDRRLSLQLKLEVG